MSSRDTILRSIRRHLPEAVEQPSLDCDWQTFADPRAQFIEMLAAVGGRAEVVADAAAVTAHLMQQPVYADAKKRCSLVDGIAETTFDFPATTDPHDLHDVDFAVLPGQFAVAENAAVWVTPVGPLSRVLYFLAQHLALVISAEAIVHNMHEAYRRIGELDRRSSPFATFISGPSKTADIEQSLVIGAHGARSLTVYLVESTAGEHRASAP